MDRRTFLRGTAGATVASLFDFGCATTGPEGLVLPPTASVDAHVERYDRVIAGIRSGPAKVAFRPEEEALVRNSLVTLFAAGSFADLDSAWQQESRVQRRLLQAMPVMDEAVFGMTDYLERIEATERHAIRERLRRPDGLLDQIVQGLGEPAALLGVSDGRRRHLEQLTRSTGARLIHQPASLIIDDTVSGIRRLEARHGWTPESRAVMAAQIQKRLRDEPPKEWVGSSDDDRALFKQESLYAESLVTGGAITLGVGAGLAALGFGLGATVASGMLIVGTIGAIALVIGLIVLIVGLVKRP